MGTAIFIGDELSAAGFRLTGIEIVVPEPDAAAAALDDARQRAHLIFMTAGLAERLPAATLEAALLAETPTLAIIPDVLFRNVAPDLGKHIKSVLGIES
jgi:vacuolar-type H+-ATPase subunit F/Vma7